MMLRTVTYSYGYTMWTLVILVILVLLLLFLLLLPQLKVDRNELYKWGVYSRAIGYPWLVGARLFRGTPEHNVTLDKYPLQPIPTTSRRTHKNSILHADGAPAREIDVPGYISRLLS